MRLAVAIAVALTATACDRRSPIGSKQAAIASSAPAYVRPPLCVEAARCCHVVESIVGERCDEAFQIPEGTNNKQCEFTLRGYRLKLALKKLPMPAECPDKLAE